MGELYVSASEIELFDLCPRKWAFAYIEQKRAPPNDAAALGTRVHAILEKWLRDGAAPDTLTDEGAIAASGLHLLPPPRTPTLVTEEVFRFTSKRAWYTGYKDFRYRDANGLLHVGDHKTTKAATWMKSQEEILAHPQALIYAVDEFFKNPNDNHLALDWIYYKTTGSRKAEPRFQIVTRDVVAEMFFEHVDPVAGEITALHHNTPAGASALDFRPDFRACDAFGGCAFLSICNPSPTERVQATMTQAGLSLADKLKAMKNGRGQSPIHPPEAYQTAPQVPVMPVAAPQAPYVPPAAPVMPVAAGYSVPGGPPQVPYGAPPAQVPLALPVPGVQAAPQSLSTPQVVAAAVLAPAPYQAPPASTFAVEHPLLGQVEPPAPAAPKKPRGRPKKATAATTEVDAHQWPAEPPGFTLYVGCAPIGTEVTSALEYVNAAHEYLKENYREQVPVITHYREIVFGKGPAELCKALEFILASVEATGDVVLGTTQIEEDTASVWLSKASKVVRAFR